MLSIVIPIYNQDVRPLVYALLKQCNKLDLAFQILCFDDCSEQKYKDLNKELAFVIHVNYTEMTENLGRSRIRNWLGKAAFHPYILFLDGDSAIKGRDFIKNYLRELPYDGVICGGRDYQPSKPRSKKKMLHWKYGRSRESLPASKRNKEPWLNFHSNNFIIPESVFRNHFFDENIKGYGYEDLLYAHRLSEAGISIRHIDNPTRHDGLETTTDFLNKTKTSIQNLALLYKEDKIPATRLIRAYEKLKRWNLQDRFAGLIEKYEDKVTRNLMSENPSVALFNLWKLRMFIVEIKNTNANSKKSKK